MSLPKSPSVPTNTSTSDARSSVVAVVAGAAEAVPGSTPTASVAASAPATALLSRPGRRRRGAGWSPRDLTALSRRAAGVLATWTLLGGSCRGCFASKAHRTWRASRPQDVPTFLTRSRAPERSPSRVHPNRPPRRLAPGTRLPAGRALAADLGVARGTVADAYAQLAAEGWLESRVGAGTWVAHRVVGPTAAPAPAAPRRLPLDLRAGIPDPTGFPRGPWLAAARRALADAPDAALGYLDPRGVLPLRAGPAA